MSIESGTTDHASCLLLVILVRLYGTWRLILKSSIRRASCLTDFHERVWKMSYSPKLSKCVRWRWIIWPTLASLHDMLGLLLRTIHSVPHELAGQTVIKYNSISFLALPSPSSPAFLLRVHTCRLPVSARRFVYCLGRDPARPHRYSRHS